MAPMIRHVYPNRRGTPMNSTSHKRGKSNDDATSGPAENGRIDPATIGTTTTGPGPGPDPELKSRIDPASIAVDWEVEAYTDEEDRKPAARWGSPPKDNFVRAHPTWKFGVYLLDCRESAGLDAEYVLGKAVARRLVDADEPLRSADVYLLCDRDGGFTFWPVRLGDPGQPRDLSGPVRSALQAVEQARRGWAKVYWRSRSGSMGWRARAAKVALDEPAWPEDPTALFLELIAARYIGDPADQRILKYIGEA
jgi:hypothetical protein